jgi:hypothetical protein
MNMHKGRSSNLRECGTSKNATGEIRGVLQPDWVDLVPGTIFRVAGIRQFSMRVIAFHEKAGRSQVDSLVFWLD